MATPTNKIIPAYPFVQYADDQDVVAFFTSYNATAQRYLDAFNNLDLPFWPASNINGYLLDWIAAGIYGQKRAYVEISEGSVTKGAYNTVEYNSITYAVLKKSQSGSALYLPDDYFKRILTWNFYKGDGFQFSIPWLKRRIARFLHGTAGLDPVLQNTFDVSITSSGGVFTITIPTYGDISRFLSAAISQDLVNLPFIYTFNVTVTE